MILRAVQWVQKELQSRLDPVGYARSLGVQVGEGCQFFGLGRAAWGSEPYLITLGNRVYIVSGARFLTHDGTVLLFREEHPDIDLVAPIRVEDNVFIGTNAVILPGVTIGHDSVIGAGAVVTSDIPPRSIAVGVPAKVVTTVDAWFEKHRARFMPVARLSPEEKRRIFLERFGNSPRRS